MIRLAVLLCVCLVLACCTIDEARASEQTRRILQALDAEYEATTAVYVNAQGALPTNHLAFLKAIDSAYSESGLTGCKSHLSVAVFSDITLSNKPEYYGCYGEKFRDSAASTIKAVLLAATLHFCDEGLITLEDQVDGRTVEDHCVAMIAGSNNNSANALLQYLSYDRINGWLAEVGFRDNELSFGRLFKPTKYVIPSTDDENFATAYGLAKFYFLMASPEIDGFLTAGSLNKARKILACNQLNNKSAYNDRLNGKLSSEITFYHKTGENSQVLGDGGIFSYAGTKYILVVFDSGKDRKAMQNLGAAIFKLMQEGQL